MERITENITGGPDVMQGQQHDVISGQLKIFLKVFLSCVAACGILGNSLTLLAVGASRKLWTAPTSFVINLTIADLYVCLVHIPLTLAYDLSPPPHNICVYMGFSSLLGQMTSIGNLCMIAVNRYIFICRSIETYQKVYTFRNTLILNLAVWIVTIGMFIPPFFGWGRLGWNVHFGGCSFVNDTETYWYIFIMPDSMIVFPTMAVTLVCYIRIMLTFHRSHKRIRRAADSATHTTDGRSSSNNAINKQSSQRIWKMRSVLLNMFLMWALFILCWGPIIATHKIDYYRKVSPSVYHVLYTFAITNSMVNFLLYAALNRHYRQAYVKLLCRKSNIVHVVG